MSSVPQAIRSVFRSPLYVASYILVMALGVGAGTALFSVANWALFRPVPAMAGADELVMIDVSAAGATGARPFSHPTAMRLTRPNRTLSAAAAFRPLDVDVQAEAGVGAVRYQGQVVMPGYFAMLGVSVVVGRTFTADEGAPGAPRPVAVISHDLWERLFGGAPDAVGRTVGINGTRFTVVGVARRAFRGVRRTDQVDVWIPASTLPTVIPRLPPGILAMQRAPVWYWIVGRRAPGASVNDVAADLRRAAPEIERAGLQVNVYEDATLPQGLRERVVDTVAALFGLVGLLFVLTGASLANLVLSRLAGRRRDLAIRRALGASSGHLAADLVAESAMLAAVGTLAAVVAGVTLVAAVGGTGVFPWLADAGRVPVDARVLGFATAMALLVMAVATATGALRAGKGHPLDAFREREGWDGSRRRMRRGLLAVQLAAALAMVVGANVMIRSLARFYDTDLGYEPRGVTLFSLNPGVQRYSDDDADRLFRALAEDVRDLPGVEAVGFTWIAPLGPRRYAERVSSPEGEGVEPIAAEANMASPDYFRALGLRLVAGRVFDEREYDDAVRGDRGEVVINRALAQLLFPEGAAVGRTIRMEGRNEAGFDVIGVIDDARLASVRDPDGPRLFDPFGNGYRTTDATFAVRSSRDPGVLLAEIRRLVTARDPRLPILDATTLSDRVRAGIEEERTMMRISVLFGVLSLILGAAGLYGLMAETVHAGLKAMAVRRALGAGRRRIARMVLLDGLRPVGLGVLLGLGLAVWTVRWLGSVLAAVDAFDPMAFLSATGILGGVAVVAALVPAVRSTRVDPARILRVE